MTVLKDSENDWKEDKAGLSLGLIQQGQGMEISKKSTI